LLAQDVNQSVMFAIMDTNSDSEISLNEFRLKLRALHIQIDEEEIVALFKKLDKNGSNSIDLSEFVTEFQEINTSQNIKKMKNIFDKSAMDPESYFNNNCHNDRKK